MVKRRAPQPEPVIETPPQAAAHSPRKSLEPRRLPSRRRGVETVELVLQTASAEIAREGLDRITVKRIADAAGLSASGIYGYFPNKEAIVSTLIMRWHDKVFEVVEGLHPRFNPDSNALGYLEAQIDRLYGIYKDQPGLVAMFDMLPAMHTVAEVTARHDLAVRDSVRTALAHYLPRAPHGEVDAAAMAMSAMGHELMLLAIEEPAESEARLLKILKTCSIAVVSRLMTL